MVSRGEMRRIFSTRDFKIMKWTILRYICQNQDKELFMEEELFLQSGLKGLIGSEDLMKDYVLNGTEDNVYALFMTLVMSCLVVNGFLTKLGREYRRGRRLMDNCNEYFLKYMMGDIDTVN